MLAAAPGSKATVFSPRTPRKRPVPPVIAFVTVRGSCRCAVGSEPCAVIWRRMLAVERARFERIVTPLQADQAFQAGYQAGLDIDLGEAVRELRAGDQALTTTSADRATGFA
jgi:hypothetical protein